MNGLNYMNILDGHMFQRRLSSKQSVLVYIAILLGISLTLIGLLVFAAAPSLSEHEVAGQPAFNFARLEIMPDRPLKSAQSIVDEPLFPVRRNDKAGFIDPTGRIVIPLGFDKTDHFYEGLAAVEIAGQWGFINKQGRTVIKPQFLQVSRFSEGLAFVCVDLRPKDKPVPLKQGCGYIDTSGRFLIPPQYDFKWDADFSDGVVVIGKNTTSGYKEWVINREGKVLVDFDDKTKFEGGVAEVGNFSEGLAATAIVRRGWGQPKLGFIDRTGQIMIEPQFENWMGLGFPNKANGFHNGLARVMLNGKWGFIDKTGAYTINAVFDDATEFSEGFAFVNIKGQWSVINTMGKMISSLQFRNSKVEYLGGFSEGLALIKINGKYGFIDQKGNLVIPPRYGYATSFRGGLAQVSLWYPKLEACEKYGAFHDSPTAFKFAYIDKAGRYIWGPFKTCP
jgi:hypothetical protein